MDITTAVGAAGCLIVFTADLAEFQLAWNWPTEAIQYDKEGRWYWDVQGERPVIWDVRDGRVQWAVEELEFCPPR
jgi:hypothetical protein